jgi:hypothetical protein
VNKAIELSKEALADGKCVIIGLQSTGEARASGAAKAAGLDKNEGGEFGDAFVSAPNEDLKRIILQLFPLPPRPKGVIAPEFLNPLKKDLIDSSELDDSSSDGGNGSGRQPRRRARMNVNYSERDVDEDGNIRGKRDRSRPGGRKNGKKRRSSLSASTTTSDDESASLGSNDSDDSVDTADLGLGSDSEDSTDEEESSANGDEKQFTQEKKSRSVPWNEIDMNLDESLMGFKKRVDYQRMKNYRKACEMVKKWLDSGMLMLYNFEYLLFSCVCSSLFLFVILVEKLQLPANPLDRLLNELGGPDKGKCNAVLLSPASCIIS